MTTFGKQQLLNGCSRVYLSLLQVDMIAGSVPAAALTDVLAALADYMTDSPHLEFLLKWVRSLCLRHGTTLQVRRPPHKKNSPLARRAMYDL